MTNNDWAVRAVRACGTIRFCGRITDMKRCKTKPVSIKLFYSELSWIAGGGEFLRLKMTNKSCLFIASTSAAWKRSKSRSSVSVYQKTVE